MKKLILNFFALIAICISGTFVANAQEDSTSKSNGKIINIDKEQNIISIGYEDSSIVKKGFIGGLTLSRIDLGFTRLLDNNNFTLSSDNDFLDYKGGKSSTFSFDVIQYGYRFNPNFKIYLAGGFDWTMLRLNKNITIDKNSAQLTYTTDPIEFSKNRFSSSYVHFPLNFEIRSKENDKGNRFYLIFGPEVAFLLNGKVKQKSDERGQQKMYDDYHFQKIRYGGNLRIGFGSLGLFTKYYFNDMFDTQAQSGLKNLSFGVTLGLH